MIIPNGEPNLSCRSVIFFRDPDSVISIQIAAPSVLITAPSMYPFAVNSLRNRQAASRWFSECGGTVQISHESALTAANQSVVFGPPCP